tara:strand:+ start:417 stop:701 length:285 start_codon:yes stop_codon:yes gene_type:complete
MRNPNVTTFSHLVPQPILLGEGSAFSIYYRSTQQTEEEQQQRTEERRRRRYQQHRVSLNYEIKFQLADLIFDIKRNLPDATYKEIMEKIALIST